MIIGGAFLCFEGMEKLVHKLRPKLGDGGHNSEIPLESPALSVDPTTLERDKIKGAVRTDFILSAEIIVISLGTVAKEAFVVQVCVLIAIAFMMTVGVYGLVAGIVKLDDLGLYFSRHKGESTLIRTKRALGFGILRLAPWLMKFLFIAGTAAMFLVGGAILSHNVPSAFAIGAIPTHGMLGMLAELMVGVIVGAIVFGVVKLIGKLHTNRESIGV
jgi:predicted DNA repair protein MutK